MDKILLKNRALNEENRKLRLALKKKDKELALYDSLSVRLISKDSVQSTLNKMLEKTRATIGAEAWSVLIPENDPAFDLIKLRVSKKIKKIAFRGKEGIAGHLIETGEPVIIKDPQKDKRYEKSVDSYDGRKISSMIAVPIRMKDRVTGVIRLINKKDDTKFSESDLFVLTNAAAHAGMIIERAYLNSRIKNDDLTNLYNIRYLYQVLETEIVRAERYDFDLSLIFMDLDNFKKVNDSLGHLAGSGVLVELARLLQSNLRKIDIITRYGGDEFVIVLPQTPFRSTMLVAERIRKIIENNVFLKEEGYKIKLTASLGVASFPDHAKSREELLGIADKAMYHGKRSTKNVVYAAK